MTDLRHAPLALEEFIWKVAPPFYVDNVRCANNWEELREWRWRADVNAAIPVSGKFCDGTIWRSARTNCAFRAWHDTLHLQLHRDFSAGGELDIARAHQVLLPDHLDDESRLWLWADTAGQTLHHQVHGDFPDDQKAFVNAVVDQGMQSALRVKW